MGNCIATVALVGSALLIRGEIDIPLFFMFLLVASRLYAPLEGALQNLAAVISTKTNINRMNEILDQPIQTGTDRVYISYQRARRTDAEPITRRLKMRLSALSFW